MQKYVLRRDKRCLACLLCASSMQRVKGPYTYRCNKRVRNSERDLHQKLVVRPIVLLGYFRRFDGKVSSMETNRKAH